MDEFKCFVVSDSDLLEPYPCDELMDDNISKYYLQFCMFMIVIVFLCLIRPIIIRCANKCRCLNNNEVQVTTSRKSNKEIQCNIDVGVHRVSINPDNSLNLLEEAL